MPRDEQVILSYRFLREHAINGTSFTLNDILDATQWEESSFDTYRSKHWGGLLVGSGRGEDRTYKVQREFLRVTQEEFLRNATQKRLIVPRYQRAKHEVVLQFEFLLPLSKEEQLRRALD